MTNIKENTKQSHEAKEKQSDETNVNNKQIATAKTPRHDDANESVIANQSVIARGACTERSRSKAISPKETKSLKPKLRFKEFEGEWKETTLGELFTFKNGLNSDKEKYGSGIKFINVLDIIGEDVITYDSIIGMVEVTDKELKKNEVIFGDVLFQRSSETREEVGQANVYVDEKRSAVFGGFVIRGRKKVEYNPYFINYLLKTSPARKEITTKSGGSTRYNVGQESLSQVFVKLTGVKEQQKIANFLTAVDIKLQQLTTKAALLAQYKKGVMQQLFSQQLRFKPDVIERSACTERSGSKASSSNETQFPDWEEKTLGEVSIRNSKKNKEDKVSFVLTNSATQGVVSQQDYFDRDIANKNNLEGYYIVAKDDFIYNPRISVHAPVGPIKRNKLKEGVMSPLYSVFRFNENNLEYFEYFFETIVWHKYLNSVANFGARHDRMNISNSDFFKMPIPMPCDKERQKIATYLSAIDLKIEAVQTQITHTQQFKKGVLQQMFV